MGDVIDFKNGKKINPFKESLKVDTSAYNRRQVNSSDDRVSYIGDRIAPRTPEQRRNHARLRAEAERRYNSKDPKQRAADLRDLQGVFTDENRRSMPRRTVKKPTPRKAPKKLKGSRLAIIGAIVAAMTVGTIAISTNISKAGQENQPITLEQAIDMGKSSNDLAIDSNTLERITDLQERLDGEIDYEELISIGEELESLQFDVIKSKVSDTLGVNMDDIEVKSVWRSNDEPTVETIIIKDGNEEKVYGDSEYSNNKAGSISDPIEEYIKTIVNTQVNEGNVKDGEFNKDDVVTRYKETLESTSEFAAGVLKVNDDGNLVIEQTQQKDIEARADNEITNDGDER